MKDDLPLLSIVIANYNYGRFLVEAIQSVLRQCDADMRLPNGERIELIIVDGGSTDNSVEIIQSFSDRLGGIRFSEAEMASSKVLEHGAGSVQPFDSRTSELQNFRTCFLWCSEKDRGQSHAFNKGFAQAKGQFLTWLNADDILLPGTIACLAKEVRRSPNAEWFTGNFIRFEQTGSVVQVGWGPHWYPGWLQRPNSPVVVFGPTSFFAKTAYESVGRIDESMHYVMDSDLWLRFMAAGVKQRRVRTLCWGFRMHESSKTAEFSDHVVSDKVASAMALESRRSETRVGYRMSSVLKVLSMLFRCVDGSLFRKLMYKLTLRDIHQVKGLKI